MHLIYNVYFVPPLCRTVGDLLPYLTDIVHTVVGRRVNLDHIHRRACRDGPAHLTLPARTPVHRMLTVDRLCKNLSHGSLSGSPGPAEKIRMSDTVRFDLILQCCNDMILPLHISEF